MTFLGTREMRKNHPGIEARGGSSAYDYCNENSSAALQTRSFFDGSLISTVYARQITIKMSIQSIEPGHKTV